MIDFLLSIIVSRIVDGDTIILTDKTKVRMLYIDAPEMKQEFGTNSKDYLSNLVLNRNVKVTTKKKDMYGRSLAEVSIGKIKINDLMIEKGMAWQYYDKDKGRAAKQSVAKANKIGLWVNPNPTPPWEYRKVAKAKR